MSLLNPYFYATLPQYLFIDISEELSNLVKTNILSEIPTFRDEYLPTLLDYTMMVEDNYENLDTFLFEMIESELPDERLSPLLSILYTFALSVADKIKRLGGYVKEDSKRPGFFPYLVKNIYGSKVVYQKISSDEIEQFYDLYVAYCIEG